MCFLQEKQKKNFARRWPEPGSDNQPVEHIRLDTTGAVTVTHAENCNVKRLRDQDVECNCGAATGAGKEG